MVVTVPLFLSLSGHPLFNGMCPEVVQKIALHSHYHYYRPHHHFVQTGDCATHIFLLLQGWVKLYRLSENGQEITVGLNGPHEVLFEEMISSDGTHSVGAITISEVRAISIPITHMRQYLREHPELIFNLMKIIAWRLGNIGYLVELLLSTSATERVEKLLLHLMLRMHGEPVANFTLPFSKGEMAQYIGLSRETFSRSLHSLQAAGISVENRTISMGLSTGLCHACDTHTCKTCHRKEVQFCTFSNHASGRNSN